MAEQKENIRIKYVIKNIFQPSWCKEFSYCRLNFWIQSKHLFFN
jgi:hypothetical protein